VILGSNGLRILLVELLIIVANVYSTKLLKMLFALNVLPDNTNSTELTLGVDKNNVEAVKLECITEI
jgi:hypothetical protein